MPLFDYTCKKCEHTFEALVFGDEAVECPECHGRRVERLLSVPARPHTTGSNLPMACGDPGLPPCGAPWCQRKGST
jgi:putative FmdB family regulatory protein